MAKKAQTVAATVRPADRGGKRGALSAEEATALAGHEKTIATNFEAFVKVGAALAAIRDGRLYRATHRTFEDYVQDRWEWTRQRAYQLIGAADVAKNVNCSLHVLPERDGMPPRN